MTICKSQSTTLKCFIVNSAIKKTGVCPVELAKSVENVDRFLTYGGEPPVLLGAFVNWHEMLSPFYDKTDEVYNYQYKSLENSKTSFKRLYNGLPPWHWIDSSLYCVGGVSVEALAMRFTDYDMMADTHRELIQTIQRTPLGPGLGESTADVTQAVQSLKFRNANFLIAELKGEEKPSALAIQLQQLNRSERIDLFYALGDRFAEVEVLAEEEPVEEVVEQPIAAATNVADKAPSAQDLNFEQLIRLAEVMRPTIIQQPAPVAPPAPAPKAEPEPVAKAPEPPPIPSPVATKPKRSRLRTFTLAAITSACIAVSAAVGFGFWDTYYQQGPKAQYEEITKIEEVREANPDESFRKAWSLYRMGSKANLLDAESQLLSLLRVEHLKPKVSYTLGLVSIRQNELEEAEGFLAIANSAYDEQSEPIRSEGKAKVILNRAEILRLQGKLNKALAMNNLVGPSNDKLKKKALILKDLERWSELKDVGHQLIKLGSTENKPTWRINGHGFVGYAEIFDGNLEEGERHTDIAESISETLDDDLKGTYLLLNRLALAIAKGEPEWEIENELHQRVRELGDSNLSREIAHVRTRAFNSRIDFN